MMHFVFRAMVALALMSAVSEAQGQSVALAPVRKPDIKVGLLIGGSQAGQPDVTWVGVRIDLGSGWKTYWKSPGDSGLPTEFDWSGSSNIVSRGKLACAVAAVDSRV